MPDLFEFFGLSPGARTTDPETSHLAADAHPGIRAKDRKMVLQAMAANPEGLTDYELADIVGRQQNRAGKRRGELRDAGLVEETLERRPAPSGASAIVWRITATGALLAQMYRRAAARK